jgi:CheY-like chemotaxis protein
MLSHELRTPLTAILGWAGMLRSGRLGPDDREQALEVIQRNARLQRQLIDELLDVSRIVAGELELDVAPIELGQVLTAATESMRPAAEAKGVSLDCQDCDSPAIVDGDAARLHQVIVNLLSNAVKFTPRGGRVELSIAVVGARANVTVADTGRGIDPAFLPHIFDRFRQATAAPATARSGLGLGLAIVHHLVSLHGGAVRAYSGGEGTGARFIVSLPLSAARGHEGSTAALEIDAAALAGVRVLVVDDEPDTLEMLGAALTLHQATVTRARSAEEALAAFADAPPDAIVSDIRMPGMDGYAFIEAVRRHERGSGRHAAAVAVTADAAIEDRDRARRAGFDAHVAKPVDARELVTALLALLPKAPASSA